MSNLLVAPITKKGQVTLPKAIRTVLRLNKGPDMVAFHIEKNGKVRIVSIEVKEKKPPPTLLRNGPKLKSWRTRKDNPFNRQKPPKNILRSFIEPHITNGYAGRADFGDLYAECHAA